MYFLIDVFCLIMYINVSHAGSAMQCVSSYIDDGQILFKNNCNFNVFISFCSISEKVSGKHCGDSISERGPYYTHFIHTFI